eukprot:765017-Pelagomonas_calceolata.AAC.1
MQTQPSVPHVPCLHRLINAFFPFNPPFPTIGMCPSGEQLLAQLQQCSAVHKQTGWKGTWVCEADKHKALEMYKVRGEDAWVLCIWPGLSIVRVEDGSQGRTCTLMEETLLEHCTVARKAHGPACGGLQCAQLILQYIFVCV